MSQNFTTNFANQQSATSIRPKSKRISFIHTLKLPYSVTNKAFYVWRLLHRSCLHVVLRLNTETTRLIQKPACMKNSIYISIKCECNITCYHILRYLQLMLNDRFDRFGGCWKCRRAMLSLSSHVTKDKDIMNENLLLAVGHLILRHWLQLII